MMLSSSARASSALAFVLALLLPSLARAQQPMVPPVGEPPPPEARGQEQAIITGQAQQVYAVSHQNELRQEATRQVEEERRSAWLDRGLDDTSSPRRTSFSLGLTGRFGVGFEKGTAVPLGITTEFGVHRKGWGAGLDVGLLSLRTAENIRMPAAPTGAVITEGSIYIIIAGDMLSKFSAAFGVWRFGNQLLVPLGQSPPPTTYFSCFTGIGGTIPIRPIVPGKSWVGFSYDFRLGYRFSVGKGIESPLQGGYFDLLTGPVVGF